MPSLSAGLPSITSPVELVLVLVALAVMVWLVVKLGMFLWDTVGHDSERRYGLGSDGGGADSEVGHRVVR
jgi:hypothetical protein